MERSAERSLASPHPRELLDAVVCWGPPGTRMKFFFPDSQDLVDPSFDFHTERRAVDRLRQRDDVYAHEVFSAPAYDGILVSKGIVEGFGGSGGRYTLAQRHRLLRVGVREFFRLDR